MYVYIIKRADGWVYNHKRAFEPESEKSTPIVYRLKQHASTAVTNLASEDWDRQSYAGGFSRVRDFVYWYKLTDNEQEELKAPYRIVRCRLVEDPE